MVDASSAVTTTVVAEKVAVLAPTGTITNCGTLTYFVLLLVRET